MSTFQFDTSGDVWLPEASGPQWERGVTWKHLTPFAQGYVTAMAREAWEGLDQNQKDRLDHFGPIAFSDFAPETLARGMRDCEAWRAEFVGETRETSGQRADMGAEFWRIRQEGKRRTYPPLSLVIAEDGLLHAEEPR